MRQTYLAAIIATVIAAPALAADADSHAAHHPQASAATPAPTTAKKKATAQANMMDKCAMMQGAGSASSMMGQGSGSMAGAKSMDCSMMKAKADSMPKNH